MKAHEANMVLAFLAVLVGGCASVPTGMVSRDEILRTASAQFCDYRILDINGHETHVYDPIHEVTVPCEEAVAWASALSTASEGTGPPWIGYLAKVVLLDGNRRPMAIVDVINWDCNVSISRCRRIGQYYHVESRDVLRPLELRSEEFARDIFAFMQEAMPERLQAVRRDYRTVGEDLESLLFQGKSSR